MNPDTLISLEGAVIANPLRRLSAPASFRLQRGECIAIVGPNGSGKSTLLEMIRGGFYLREGSLRLNLQQASYKAIRSVAFDNAYSTTETQYYHQQRWQAFERETSPLAGELLGIVDAEAGMEGGEMGLCGGEAGMDGGEAGIRGGEAGIRGGEAARIGSGEAGTSGCEAGMTDMASTRAAYIQTIDIQKDTQIYPLSGRGSNCLEATETKTIYQRNIQDANSKDCWQQRLLDVLDIRPLLDRAIITLSSGELRRFSLARALMDKPEVLILESPFIGLDPATRQMLCVLLESVLSMGVSIVMTLTDTARVPDVVTHVYRMKDGRLSDKINAAAIRSAKADVQSTAEEAMNSAETAAKNATGLNVAAGKSEAVTQGTASEPAPGAVDIPAQTEIRSGRKDVSEPHLSHNDGRCEAILTHSAQELFREAQAFNTVVQMRNINIAYGQRQIFKDLNWTVHSGEKWNVTGPNGSGKSTLLSLVNADNPKAYSLDITLFDRRRGTGESIWDIKRHIGYLSSEMHSSFRENLPVMEIVRSGLGDRFGGGGLTGRMPGGKLTEAQTDTDYRSTINYDSDLQQNSNNQTDSLQPHNTKDDYLLLWLRLFGAEHLAQRSYLTLSSGEQRFILLIRAFVKDPDLLILDEPFQGLDPALRSRAAAIIKAFCSRRNKTLIFVTHYIEEIPDVVTNTLQL